MNKVFLFRLAWTVIPKLPIWLTETVADISGRVAAFFRIPSVRQMEANFEKLSGQKPTRRQMGRAVSSYFRCLNEQFSLSGWNAERLRTSTVYTNIDHLKDLLEDGPVVLALTHSGNWDLAAAWFCQNHGPIVTVAERLEPVELFDGYVRFREAFGAEIIGVSKGEKVFDQLVSAVKGRSVLVPLLADRDISGSGIEVQLGTQQALVAAGPAALALHLDRPLIAGHMVYRREKGRWIVHLLFTEPLDRPAPVEGETAVEALTKTWVNAVQPLMVAGITDWHMMQKLYLSDLDGDRLSRARLRHEQEVSGTNGVSST